MNKKKKQNPFRVTREELGFGSARSLSLALGFSDGYWSRFEKGARDLPGGLSRALQAFYLKKMKRPLSLDRFAGY